MENKKIATRESYGNALAELGKTHENLVVLDADLAEATKTAIFRGVFPERHIDCGIAECNMIGIAAGLAASGKVPFASSFAMFAAGRAFEQVRNLWVTLISMLRLRRPMPGFPWERTEPPTSATRI